MVGFSFGWARTVLVLAGGPLLILLLSSSVSLAEVRVIVEYDNAEHRILRLIDLPTRRSVPISDHLAGKPKAGLNPRNVAVMASKVKLLWYGADGEVLSTDFMHDPRLTHVPLSDSDQSPTVVGLDTGAFMVTGPTESVVLEIHMPQNSTLGLDRQFWRMMLVR